MAALLDMLGGAAGSSPTVLSPRAGQPPRPAEPDSVDDHMVPAVSALPSRRRAPRPPTRGLPLPCLYSPARRSSLYYVVTSIDNRGRVADRSAVRVLEWTAGQSLAMSVTSSALVIVAHPEEPQTITDQGHLRVPAAVRRVYRLESGDRLLLAACPQRGVLVAYSMATVDAMLLAYHATLPDEGVR